MLGRQRRFRRVRAVLRAFAPALVGILAVWVVWLLVVRLAGC